MKQITVLSGKGGTGKTTITASFAALAHDIVIADCDVDAPDLHMLLHPQLMKTQEFKGPKLAVIDRANEIEDFFDRIFPQSGIVCCLGKSDIARQPG